LLRLGAQPPVKQAKPDLLPYQVLLQPQLMAELCGASIHGSDGLTQVFLCDPVAATEPSPIDQPRASAIHSMSRHITLARAFPGSRQRFRTVVGGGLFRLRETLHLNGID